MPFQEKTRMSECLDFVTLAAHENVNMRALCRGYGISAKTGYKWLRRWEQDGPAGLGERSRRPHTAPTKTAAALEAQVVALRQAHPTWGGRKLHHRLRAQGLADVPAPSTITTILHRHGLIAADRISTRAPQRFEHAIPNDLWQLDFLGHRPLDHGQRVHPLTLVDDHSRFLLSLVACADERQATGPTLLTACFRRVGLPAAILTDNGPPWGTSGAGGVTALEAWLLRLGVALWHGRAYHPQTQGKVERLHGTIVADVFAHHHFPDLASCQAGFDAFRVTYNHERPHQALADAVPASRYTPSPRLFPETLPPLTYGPADDVRVVRGQGAISFHNRSWFVSRGLIGLPVAVRPTTADGVFQVIYCQREVATIDLTDPVEV
jgi:transposase InsO family protein